MGGRRSPLAGNAAGFNGVVAGEECEECRRVGGEGGSSLMEAPDAPGGLRGRVERLRG